MAGSSRGRAGSTPSVRESRPAQPTKKGEEKMIDAEGSRLLADVFNTLTEGQENIMPEDVAERIERFMTANGFRMVFSRWYLQCEPEVKQEPVAWLSVDCIGERYLCFSKPVDNDPVTPLYTYHPDAQAEITKRDARIAELESEAIGWRNTNAHQLTAELNLRETIRTQAAEIARLKAVIGECKDIANKTINARWMVLSPTQTFSATDLCNAKRIAACEVARRINEAVAAIKEEGL